MPNNKIKGYLSVWIVANSGQVNSMFILIYRVYQYNFDETHKKDFHVSKNSHKQIDMMELTGKRLLYHYSDNLNAHLLSVPYKSEKY